MINPMDLRNSLILKGLSSQLPNVGSLPSGVSAAVSGMLEEVGESVVTWMKRRRLGILGVFLVMAFSFESLITPAVILLTLPLAAIGGAWGINRPKGARLCIICCWKWVRTRIVILSTHIVDDITSSCRRVAVLNRGEVIYEGGLNGIQTQAANRIWEVILSAHDGASLWSYDVLFRKHIDEGVLYHYVADKPYPGSRAVDPTFEDAYVSLLLKHNTARLRTAG